MINRRTLAALTAVAAFAGGSAGAVTSGITTPEGAQAQVSQKPITKVLGRKVIQVNPAVLNEILRTDSDRIKAIEKSVNNLTAAVGRIEARAGETDQKVDALTSMTARSGNGRTLINLVDDILGKSRLICADVVGDVLPIAPDRHVTACD